MRLTDNLRGTILRAILVDRLQADYSAIAMLGGTLASDIYNAEIPAFIMELPPGVCPTNSHVHFQAGTHTDGLHFNGTFDLRHPDSRERFYGWFEDTVAIQLPFPFVKNNSVVAIYEPSADPKSFYRQIEDQFNRQKDFQTKFFEVHTQVKTVLATFTTVENLLKAWPECRPFIPPEKAPVQLPALPISELNEMLKLP